MKKLRIGLLCLFLSSIVCNQTIQCWSIADTGRLVVNTLKENLRPSVVGPFLRQYFTITVPRVFVRIQDQLLVNGLVTGSELLFNFGRYVITGKESVSSALETCVPHYATSEEGIISPASVPECIRNTITLINEPERLRRIQTKLHPAQMLVGEPGCGKTHLGEYLAKATGCKLAKVAASSLITGVQGTGASSIRELYKRGLTSSPTFLDKLKRRFYYWARFKKYVPDPSESKPLILILDEIDGFGRRRNNLIGDEQSSNTESSGSTSSQVPSSSSSSSPAGHSSEFLRAMEQFVDSVNQRNHNNGSIQDVARRFNELISSVPNHSAQQNEYANTLTQLFKLIDDANRGSGVLPKVFVMATSNLDENFFDPALIRRFEISHVGQLNQDQRAAVVRYHVDQNPRLNFRLGSYVTIAQHTEGCNGADFKKAIGDCARECAVANGPITIRQAHFIESALHHRDQRNGIRTEQPIQQ